MKRCFKCLRDLPLTEFYRHAQMGDGRLSKCRDCTRKDVKVNREAKLEAVRAYDRERAKLPHRVAASVEITRRWRKEHPNGQRAHNAAARAGLQKPIACEGCGREIEYLEKHHHDYSRPLLVVWLCKPCHAIADKIRRRLESA